MRTAAIIGVGKPGAGGQPIAAAHAAMYRRRPAKVRLVALADASRQNLESFGRQFAVEHAFADPREMLEKVQPQIVSICADVAQHRPLIEAAARSGAKAIVCEKPFVAAPADLPAMRTLVAQTGVKIVVPHVRRYRPAIERVRQLVAAGSIGQPISLVAAVGSGDLSDAGADAFDLIRFFMSDRPIAWVFGQARVRQQRRHGRATEDFAVAHFSFDDGARGTVEAGSSLPVDTQFYIAGSDGAIRVTAGDEQLHLIAREGGRRESYAGKLPERWRNLNLDESGDIVQTSQWDLLLADLLKWLDGGGEPITGFSTASKSCEVNLAAYVSALRGDRVELPLVDGTIEWPVELLARRR